MIPHMVGAPIAAVQGRVSEQATRPVSGQARASRIQLILRNGLPAIGVLAVASLATAIAFYVYEANRKGALELSNDLVTAIEKRISMEMNSYLEPSQRLAELIDDAVDGAPVFRGRVQAESFAKHALMTIPSATGIGYADVEGNFLYVQRTEKGTIDTKVIDRRNGGQGTTWTRRSSSGVVVSTEEVPSDGFDPRVRPWYIAAASERKPIWTDTYLNQTLRRPTISYAIPHIGWDGKLATVTSIDIELDDLCTFLSKLTIGASGKAYIIDRSGRVVAFPDADWKPANDEYARAPRLDELGDPVLTRAYNRLRVEGFGRMVLDFGDRRVIVSSEPVKMIADRDWLVLIVVPEGDFVGFVTSSSLVALLLSVGVVIIVILLAGFLGWRNMAAARQVAAAEVRRQALETRTRAIVELGRDMVGDKKGAMELENATETAAVACAARGVAIWRLGDGARTLICEDHYDRGARDHTAGLALDRDELPALFAALEEGAIIDTATGGNDRRTAELRAHYLAPFGVEDVHIVPILSGGTPIGMLAVEEPQRGDGAAGLAAFCDSLAVLLALRLGMAAPVPPPAAGVAAARETKESATSDAFARRRTRLENTLIQHAASLDVLSQKALAKAAIGVVKLPDWTTVAHQPPDSGARTAMDAIVTELRSVVEKSGVSYAALLDDQMVLAAFSADEDGAGADAQCVAVALLELRDHLLRLEEKWGVSLDFRLAMDIGTVMSSAVASDPPSRNLWGGAIGIAKILAATTARGTIAASETAYELLSRHFVFRARGSYFLPETGNMRTFVLVGQA
jgi:class 3 adenylate cyclase